MNHTPGASVCQLADRAVANWHTAHRPKDHHRRRDQSNRIRVATDEAAFVAQADRPRLTAPLGSTEGLLLLPEIGDEVL